MLRRALLAAATVAAVAWVGTRSWDPPATDEDLMRASVQVERVRQAEEVAVVAAEFRRSWARSDIQQVKGFLHVELQEAFWPQVVEVLDRRGWARTLPELGEGVVSDHGDGSFDVRYSIAGGEPLLTRWMRADGVWRIGRMLFPPP